MVCKTSSQYYCSSETLLKFKLHPKFAYPLCRGCKKRKDCIKVKCEVDYRSDKGLECNKKMWYCESCFTPSNVFVCKKHESDLNVVYCDYTGSSYSESPVYYCFHYLGIRRVNDTTCKRCDKVFQVCGYHTYSPIKFHVCAMCLKGAFECYGLEYVHGLKNDPESIVINERKRERWAKETQEREERWKKEILQEMEELGIVDEMEGEVKEMETIKEQEEEFE